MRSMRVGVVGAGVVGLTVAAELARAGHRVTVVADATAADSVSGVAGGIWFPYKSERSPHTARIEERSLRRMEALAGDAATGVAVEEGLYVERTERPDRSWTGALRGPAREADLADLPAGAPSGLWVRLPMITMPRYLSWLEGLCVRRGVAFRHATVRSLEELTAHGVDLAVVAAGLRSGPLLGDEAPYPIRGQVLRVENPGLHRWVIDNGNPAGSAYVLPRGDGVVCGGTEDAGAWDRSIDPAEEAAIHGRALALEPALAGCRVLGRSVGLRPARDALRVERVEAAVPTIACYGHGGAGVTLSWGSAEHVAELVAEAA